MAQEKHYEMQWDCQFCGTSKLLGKSHRFCPNCGGPQDPDARYFPSDDEKVAVEDHQFVGKDVTCPACGGLNSGDAVHCGACGAPLEGAEAARTATAGFTSSAVPVGSRDVAQEQFEREMAAAGVTTDESEKKKGGSRIALFAVIGAVIACVGLFVFLTRTSDASVIATGHSWEREILIEQYQETTGEDWQDEVPSGAYDESCSLRERDTRQVEDGETCRTERRDNGDGTFTEREVCEPTFREEAVMDDWCTYSLNVWEQERAVTTTGTSLSDTPAWGDVSLSCTGERLGCEREAGREETYTVTFRDDEGATYDCDFSFDEWQDIPVESRWDVEVRQVGGGVACATLEQVGG